MINFKQGLKIYIWSVIAATVLFISYSWIQDILAGEEGRVKKFIMQGAKAVGEKNLLTCSNMVSNNYHDKYGNDHQSLIYFTREFFLYYKDVLVHIESMDIKLDESKTQAGVELVALVIGKTKSDTQDKILEGQKGRFRLKLIKEEKKWRLLELEFFEPINIMGQNIS